MAKEAFKFELSGFKELLDALERLPTVSMQRGAIRNALKDCAKPIVAAAQENAPYDSRNTSGKHLRDTIKVSTSLKATQRKGRYDRSSVTVYLGSTSPLAHLVEFGTTMRVLDKPRVVTFGGKTVTITNTGQMPPIPFLRQAWDGGKDKALKSFADAMWARIQRAARLLAKKAARGTLTRRQIEGLNR